MSSLHDMEYLKLLPPIADMMGPSSSDQVFIAMVAKTVGLSRSQSAWPTFQMQLNSALSDLNDNGVRFHKNLALHLEFERIKKPSVADNQKLEANDGLVKQGMSLVRLPHQN